MAWYTWSYLTLLKVEKHISKLLNTLENANFTKMNVEDFLISLLGLARNINQH